MFYFLIIFFNQNTPKKYNLVIVVYSLCISCVQFVYFLCTVCVFLVYSLILNIKTIQGFCVIVVYSLCISCVQFVCFLCTVFIILVCGF